MAATVLWPERESLYDLMRHRATIGHAAFEAEKQGNPVNPEQCEWPESYFLGEGFWFDEWPTNLELKTIGLDPSKGKDGKTGDYSAYVLYGRTPDGLEWVEADQRKDRDSTAIVHDGVEHCRRFGPDGMAVETNQFQQLLLAEFQRQGQKEKVNLPIHPVENMVKKEVRIRRLGPALAQRKMRFRRTPGTRLLVDQLRQFPIGLNDDGIDSLEMARRLAIELWNGKMNKLPKGLRV